MKDVIMIVVGLIVAAILAYSLFLSDDGLMKKGQGIVDTGTDIVQEMSDELPTTIK